jgi:hypothetical protein
MHNLIASYDVARLENAERELRAERRAIINALREAPAWRLVLADALRRLAGHLDGFQAAPSDFALSDEAEA